MAVEGKYKSDWVDGFLFVGNHLALDFLNTKPILDGERRELLPNAAALGQWLIAAGIVRSAKNKALVRAWSRSPAGEAFVRKLVAFRECLRTAILRVERNSAPRPEFLCEMNRLLQKYPQRFVLAKKGAQVVRREWFEPVRPEDAWTPILAAAAELFSDIEPARIRKCESARCVVHFYDTSRKGSRRWCSMNICGNRLKVAAYQKRRRVE